MQRSKHLVDWLSLLLFLALVGFGWLNIYSSTVGNAEGFHPFDSTEIYGKQSLWIGLSLLLVVIILSLEAKFYERYASIFYLISLLSLIGLFIFGQTISGQKGWYTFGSFSIQPAEFVKATTALTLAKYLGDLQTDIRSFKHQLNGFIIIFIPALLIIAQPDPGSALIYAAFLFPLYREGLSIGYLLLGFWVTALFVTTLAFGAWWVVGGVALLTASVLFLSRVPKNFIRYIGIALASIILVFSVDFVFHNVFKQHHRDRFNLVLGKQTDMKGIGYNTHQSVIAIGSGGLEGKGWREGTQTQGDFVPEQHTDYIFSTVGEEWGFIGSVVVIALFVLLIGRILYLSERQKSTFVRVYGYSVAGLLFVHFTINIGMVIGILPTVGIPLPFFSYGGSSLWGFTLLLFVFLKLEADQKVTTLR